MLTIKNKSEVAEIYLSGDIVDDAEGGFLEYWYEGNKTGYEFPSNLKAQLDLIKDKELYIYIYIHVAGVFLPV